MAPKTSSRTSNLTIFFLLLVLVTVSIATPAMAAVFAPAHLSDEPDDRFTFYVANDFRDGVGSDDLDTCQYFRGIVETIRDLDNGGAFMISPGDLVPLPATYRTITSTLGSSYLWFPGVGNHEFPDEEETIPGSNLDWLRAYDYDANGPDVPPNLVSQGPSGCPETTYSFDYGYAHFVMLNVYCDSSGDTETYGDVSDHLYEWLRTDLATNTKPLVFVFGHEPAYPQRDTENGRARHALNSLNEFIEHRDRFWELLDQENVTAYFNGHTHSYSAVRIDDIWQIDTGHASGLATTETRSTFVRVLVDGETVRYEAYRQKVEDPCKYELTDAWTNETSSRDIVPTPVVSPTPPPRGPLGGTNFAETATSLGLSVLTVALLVGSVVAITTALRDGRTKDKETPEEPQ